jgi:deazaflavin-dependent oxidoreductase (nitroreductase family)
MDEDLAAWGKVVVLETIGRRTGQRRRASIGFVTEPDGSLVVAASTPETQWAMNLLADGHCLVEHEGARLACRALLLDEPERRAAVAALILKYGTPAERLGMGPAFRLVHTEPVARVVGR